MAEIFFSGESSVSAIARQINQAMESKDHLSRESVYPLLAMARKLGFVRLVAPTTPLDRMREIASHGSGFVYLISRRGVTGVRSDVPVELPDTIARLRQATTLPVCVGFGIGSPQQARAVAQVADGVIVGSACVQMIGESPDPLEAARAFARAFKEAIRAGSV